MTEVSQENTIDPIQTAVLANRFDAIIREMNHTLLRSSRSAIINSARDFSCSILTSDNQLFAATTGLPTHVFGAHLQTIEMQKMHPNLVEGDAFLDNNPYTGNAHPADHAILVPVFIGGEHMFTAMTKAHQADIGNSVPTTYFADAIDVYHEGALIFPSVQVQRNYEDIDDIIRMCRARIRVPDQWYGDYLASLGAARIGERRLKELCAKYGEDVIKEFTRNWLSYSEKRMVAEIQSLPKATLHNSTRHDAFQPILPDGLVMNVKVDIDPENAMIEVDFRENGPNIACGLNMTESTVWAAALTGILDEIANDVPKNSGAFSRIRVLMNDGSVVGRPAFPFSASVGTTNLTDRLIECVASSFAQLGEPHGRAEGSFGIGVAAAVISGKDRRHDDQPYVNQLVTFANGGPGSAHSDGWPTFGLPCGHGLLNRDSVEIDEVKYPIQYDHMRFRIDTGGAGRFRGGLSLEVAYGPKFDKMTAIFPCDGQETGPRGVLGGKDGNCAAGWLINEDGSEVKLPNNVNLVVQPGQKLRGFDTSGGGYGDPLERNVDRVLEDVLEGWVSLEEAEGTYGVVLEPAGNGLRVNVERTRELRHHGLVPVIV